MRKLVSVIAILAACLTLTRCTDKQPDPPKPMSAPGETWELYTVKSYETIEPKYAYNPFVKRSGIWEEYRLVLQSKAHDRLTLTCRQWLLPDGSTGCGQGVLIPNDKVWTREGVSAELLWVYSNEVPKKGLDATSWHIDRRDAE